MADAAMLRIRHAYEKFLSGVEPVGDTVRSVVRESWQRSVTGGVDPTSIRPAGTASPLAGTDFEEYRAAHRLNVVRPLVQALIVDDIADADVVVAMTDRAGRLLWVEGDRAARDKAAAIDFVEGSVWSEEAVGTNAPGLALAVDRGVQIRGPEHFSSRVQKWNCAAAPVHDPATGEVLGAIDVTGGEAAGAPFALAAVRAVVAAVERELGARATELRGSSRAPRAGGTARLTVLGGPSWSTPDGRSIALSPRHAEILLMLQDRPEGVTTAELADLLSEGDLDAVTVRAEISRLRRELGDVIAARPYRLSVPVESDVADLKSLIAEGRTGEAVALLGRGGLLAESLAPGLMDLFDEIREDLRSAVVRGGDVEALSAWTASRHGRDDAEAWRRLGAALPATDPRRAVSDGRVRLIDRRHGA